MRKIFHAGVVASLVVAFAQAPLEHTHDHDPDHEHASGLSHAHWMPEHDGPEGPEIEDADPDCDARFEDWLAGDGTSYAPFVPDLPLSEVRRVAEVEESVLPEIRPQNHDPPGRLCLHPRAPPA